MSGSVPTAPSTWPTRRSARHMVGSSCVPTPAHTRSHALSLSLSLSIATATRLQAATRSRSGVTNYRWGRRAPRIREGTARRWARWRARRAACTRISLARPSTRCPAGSVTYRDASAISHSHSHCHLLVQQPAAISNTREPLCNHSLLIYYRYLLIALLIYTVLVLLQQGYIWSCNAFRLETRHALQSLDRHAEHPAEDFHRPRLLSGRLTHSPACSHRTSESLRVRQTNATKWKLKELRFKNSKFSMWKKQSRQEHTVFH